MRIPILNNNAVTMESPGNVSGSLNYGGPVPEGYMRLSDFINETGRAFFPNEWTGEECQGSWQLSFIEGFDGWLGSLIEYRVQKSLKFHEWKLRYIADGCTPSEARRRIAYRIECDKHTVAADKLRDELEKIDALLLEIKSNPPKHDSFLSETALVNRITGIEGQLEVHEGYDCFEGDLPNANTDDIEKLNRRFAKLNERCRKIKERRRVAIADGLRGALWKGDIPAGHLSLDGEFISMDRSIWYRNPDWIETMVHSCIQCQRDHEPEWKGERRSILIEYAKAKEWLAHATETEPTADPNKANTTKSGRGRESTYPGASEYVESFLTRILSAKGREFFEQKNLSSISNLVLDDNQMRKALPTFYNDKDAEGAPLPARMPSGSVIRNWIKEWSKGKGVLIGSDKKSKPST